MSNEEKNQFEESQQISSVESQQAVVEDFEPGQSEPEENPEWTDTIETEPTDN